MYNQNSSLIVNENSLMENVFTEKEKKNNSMWGAEYIVLLQDGIKKDDIKNIIGDMLFKRAIGI